MAPERGRGAPFQRGLTVLAAVAEAGEARADQVAGQVDLPLSTVYRYLRTLRDVGFVEEHEGLYGPGRRLRQLAGQGLTHAHLADLALPYLRDVSRATGETAVITVRVGHHAQCLCQVESHHAIRMSFPTRELLPLYAGAGQRILLAHAPPDVIGRVLEAPLRQITATTPDRATIEREIERARHLGFLVSHGEMSPGAVAVAVPVLAGGEIVCSLTVAGPAGRCSNAWIRQARRALQDAGERFADALAQPDDAAAPGPDARVG